MTPPLEIERRFLVATSDWARLAARVSGAARLRQGYLRSEPPLTVRVRISSDCAWLTIKGPTVGARRAEWEYPIPVQHAEDIVALCAPRVVEKTRYELDEGGMPWVIDVFEGTNAGLIIAELELDDEASIERVALPSWVGREVTSDFRYSNAQLAIAPFDGWGSGT